MDGNCFKCGVKDKLCRFPGGSSPKACSTLLYGDALKQADAVYGDESLYRFAAEASRQEGACYEAMPGMDDVYRPVKPRLLEIIEFCRRMGYKRIGFAFCGGLHKEAAAVGSLLENAGFEVVSVMCKVGGIPKARLGLTAAENIRKGNIESICNPIGQACILNEAKTEFNIILGLCVGHDSLFMKHSDALCTVFAVKDRVMGHNPLAIIPCLGTYYSYIKQA